VSRQLWGSLAILVIAVAALFALRAFNDAREAEPAPAPTTTATTPDPAPAKPSEGGSPFNPADADPSTYRDELALLASIPQRKRASASGYSRELFGERWADVDGNGCDTRNDVLARDLEDVELRRGSCLVQSGTLHDPFTGQVIEFERGPKSSEAVQIDHVVALYDAWRTGAQDWSIAKREMLANDPANLLAVEGQANQDKGHADAASWLPPNTEFHCDYVAAQVRVKASYGLWMTSQEHAASERVLSSCG